MKKLIFISLIGLLSSCGLLDGGGIIIDTPSIPSVNVCEHVATDADVVTMKGKIDSRAFKDERMQRAKSVTKGYCFVSAQVLEIMESMLFADAQLEIAKHLYKPTTDKENYDVVVDALAHKSDRDELKNYIAQN
jgi:hypothetical protein